MRGVLSWGGYVPYHRLDRADIAAVFGGTPGSGQRAVASFDEDTTSMGVEAARLAVAGLPDGPRPDAVWFATAEPAYLDKTNATAIHAALRLDPACSALDAGGAIRSGIGALRAAFDGRQTTLVVASDIRGGQPTSADESAGGDAAAAFILGEGDDVAAELIGAGSITDEVTERWRTPGDRRSRTWEERLGEHVLVPLGSDAVELALKSAGIAADDVDHVAVAGMHGRAVSRLVAKLGKGRDVAADDLSATVGAAGTAHAGLLLANVLDTATASQVILLVGLADGADALVLRTTDAISDRRPARTVADLIGAAGRVPYGKYLSWRGQVTVEPPNRPEPTRPSSSAAHRRDDWKFGLAPTAGGATLAGQHGTVATFTVDRLVYSPSPPVVFAVVDFDDGTRMACELTDVDPASVRAGDRVEMTFRRLYTADGIHNYFWKARGVR